MNTAVILVTYFITAWGTVELGENIMVPGREQCEAAASLLSAKVPSSHFVCIDTGVELREERGS